MDYIYAELDRNMLPSELALFYGYNLEMVTEKLPITALECENPEKLRLLGEFKQAYSLTLADKPMYIYFAYPTKYGDLTFIGSNSGLINEINNWDCNSITVNNNSYLLWCYRGRLAPGKAIEVIFRLKK